MKLRDDQLRLQGLLKETITLLCKNGLQFKSGFAVEALIGITTDDSDVFLVNIKESVRNEVADGDAQLDISIHKGGDDSASDSDERKPKRSRKRPPDRGARSQSHSTPIKRNRPNDDAHSDDDDDSSTEQDIPNVKREPDSEDLVFVKQEMSEYEPQNTSMSQFPGQSQSFAPQDTNYESSHDGSISGAWNQSANNMDPNAMAMAAQSPSGSQQILPILPAAISLPPGVSLATSVTSPTVLAQAAAGVVRCQLCHTVFPGFTELSIHYEMRHARPQAQAFRRPNACEYCAKSYVLKQDLKAHEFKVHGIGEPQSRCPHCGEAFAWAGQLRRHLKVCPAKTHG